jgi:chromosome segregation ATPase
MKKIVFGLVACFILFACHDVKKQKQLDKMESLINKINSIRETWKGAQIEDLTPMIEEVNAVRKDIYRKSSSLDTINVEWAQKLEDYKYISTGLSFFQSSNDGMKRNIYDTSQSLEQLNNEIKNAQGDRSKYDENIQFEEKKVTELANFLQKMLETKTICVNSYNRLHNEIKAYSVSQ